MPLLVLSPDGDAIGEHNMSHGRARQCRSTSSNILIVREHRWIPALVWSVTTTGGELTTQVDNGSFEEAPISAACTLLATAILRVCPICVLLFLWNPSIVLCLRLTTGWPRAERLEIRHVD
jgi:hypothetical protein